MILRYDLGTCHMGPGHPLLHDSTDFLTVLCVYTQWSKCVSLEVKIAGSLWHRVSLICSYLKQVSNCCRGWETLT